MALERGDHAESPPLQLVHQLPYALVVLRQHPGVRRGDHGPPRVGLLLRLLQLKLENPGLVLGLAELSLHVGALQARKLIQS